MAPSQTHRLTKHHLQPTLRGPQRSFDGTDRQIQQAGRSATNLNAQASAQSLREASRPSSCDGEKYEPLQSLGLTEHLDLPRPEPQRQYTGTLSPHAPPIPSPLGPKPSTFSSASVVRKTSDDSTSSSIGISILPRRSKLAAAIDETRSSGTQTPSRTFLRPGDVSYQESHSTSSQSTPRTVRDLGSDYTRYFNPFATRSNSANTSEQDLSISAISAMRLPNFNSSTNLAPSEAVSSADLSNRLSVHSNPFKDEKRKSSSLGSLPDSAPGTPVPQQADAQQNESTVLNAAVLQPRSGTPTFIHNANPETATFIPQYVDDRLGAPYILYMDEKEDDDDMHMPAWDDDRKYKPTIRDRFSKENIVNTIGIVFLITGLCTIFVVLPVISFTGTTLIPYTDDTPLDQMPGHGKPDPWAHVNDNEYPLLANIRTGLIDPDTPSAAMTRKSINGNELKLVFSDEFNKKNRTFYEGDDPYWYASDIWYHATNDLEWYDPDAVNTGDGTLQIQLDAFANHDLQYRSGMLNSWNQLCFKGGVFEVSVSLPGPAGIHGLWPGAWTMGNLGRPGYLSTTDGMWPYTYNDCDAGITPNQSMTDGTSFLPGQRLPNCVCQNEDHPSPGTGRGAPEIDIIEASADWAGKGYGVATQSYQVAPFDIFYEPNYDFMEIPNYNFSYVNSYTGGPFQQAVSTTTMLNNEWYDGKAYQKYAFEYQPGSDKDAHVTWFVADDEMMRFDGRAIGPNGNIQQRLIAEEPLSMILNLGFSHSWVSIDQANLKFPTVMRVDYVRWYQNGEDDSHEVTCDPQGYPTTDYIARHPEAYQNSNNTLWSDAGYSWPKNTLMHGCSA